MRFEHTVKAVFVALIFLAGFVGGINAALLAGEVDYDPSYFKIVLCIIVTALFGGQLVVRP